MLRRSMELAASLMCADFSKLPEQLDVLRASGVTRLHLDFADGHFVHNLILGTEVFQLLKGHESFLLEAHLMLQDPRRLLDLFANGSDFVIFHAEAVQDPIAFANSIRSAGARPGIALRPETAAESILQVLGMVDLVLVMMVDPGFAGGGFIPHMISKVSKIGQAIRIQGRPIDLEVDGGINPDTIPLLVDAGANVFVGGSTGLFTDGDLAESAAEMLRLLRDS